MEIIIDTREQTPYELVEAKKSKLKTGDYTVDGFEDVMAVERKSYSDLYKCLTSDLGRFKKQLKRLGKMRHSALLVDSTVSSLLLGSVWCNLPGDVALRRLLRLSVKYGVPVMFVDDNGKLVTRNLLYEWWQIEEG
jgi:ERCC4-type nuclease